MFRTSIRITLAASLTLPAFAQSPQADGPTAEVPTKTESAIQFDPSTGTAYFQDEDATEGESGPTWSGTVNVGATLAEGNTDRRTAHAAAEAIRRGEKDRITLSAQWNYADEQNPTTKVNRITQRRTRGAGKYDYFLSEKLYTFASISAEADKFADLDLRLITSVGAGYQFIEEEDLKLGAEVGLAYYQENRSTGADVEYPAATLSYALEWQATETVTFLQDVNAVPSLEDGDDIYLRKDSRARVTLTEKMFAQLQWILDYDNTPAPGLRRVDNLFLITVGWEF